jgi:hypothetical protein
VDRRLQRAQEFGSNSERNKSESLKAGVTTLSDGIRGRRVGGVEVRGEVVGGGGEEGAIAALEDGLRVEVAVVLFYRPESAGGLALVVEVYFQNASNEATSDTQATHPCRRSPAPARARPLFFTPRVAHESCISQKQ